MSVFQDILMIYDLQFLVGHPDAVLRDVGLLRGDRREDPAVPDHPAALQGRHRPGEIRRLYGPGSLIVGLSLAASYLIMNGRRLGRAVSLDGPPALCRGPLPRADGLYGPLHVPRHPSEEVHPDRAGLRIRLGNRDPVLSRIDPALLDRPLPQIAAARTTRRGSISILTFRLEPTGPATAVLALILITAVFLGLACLVFSLKEYMFED